MTSPAIHNFQPSDAQAVIDVTRETLKPQQLEIGAFYVVPTADGDVRQIDLTGDQWHDAPRRKAGTTVVRDAKSWLAYWSKHNDEDSEVYADQEARTVTAVLDAHHGAGAGARFGLHRLVLQLRHTEAFAAWRNISGKAQTQVQLAEFLEDHRPEIRRPSAAELLELATTFQATTRASFKSATVLQSGQRVLEYAETIDASAGTKGRMAIPDTLDLAIPVFEGATVADPVTARLRYRIQDGRLVLIVILDRLSEVVEAAFQAVADEIQAGVQDVPVLRGTPA